MDQADQSQLREALAKLVDVANTILPSLDNHSEHHGHNHENGYDMGASGVVAPCGCVVKALPSRLLLKSAMLARTINPVNAPYTAALAALGDGSGIMEPQRLAVLITKYWGPQLRQLTVSFMDSASTELKNRILSHMNAWSTRCGISFVLTNGVGDVRISFSGSGYWSYLGTDIALIPKNRPTMNLQGFTMKTPESEYLRVVRHETGHTMGFPHEHMRKALIDRIDKAKAYVWFLKTYGWDKATVDAQVLTPLSEASLMGTKPDQTSIMCYQLPGEITKDKEPIIGGKDINATDYQFASKVYPKAGRSIVHSLDMAASSQQPVQDEWSEEEDPEVSILLGNDSLILS